MLLTSTMDLQTLQIEKSFAQQDIIIFPVTIRNVTSAFNIKLIINNIAYQPASDNDAV